MNNPEFSLLMMIARKRGSGDSIVQIEGLLKQTLNDEYLLQLAGHQGMLPLLYMALKEIDHSIISEDLLNYLKNYYFENTQRNLSLLGELLKLIELLREHQISAIPFKGPSLSNYLYNSYSIRQAGDLDILVKPEDVIAAVRLFEKKGYRLKNPLSFSQQHALVNISSEKHLLMIADQNNAPVEIHWKMLSSNVLKKSSTDFLWNHLDTYEINSVPITIFRPEVYFLTLCLHGYKHGWSQLFWLWEIAEMIGNFDELDWEWIIQNSEKICGQRILLSCLMLADNLLGTNLPPPIKELIENNPDDKGPHNEITIMPHRGDFEPSQGFNVWSLYKRFWINETIIHRISLAIKFIITPNYDDIQAIDLKPQRFVLYYLIRPFRLLFKTIKKLISQ